MKVKSLLVAGTVAVSLGVSAFSVAPLTRAASTELTTAVFNSAEACSVDANYPVTVPNNIVCVNGEEYHLGTGEYVINENVNITKSLHLNNSTLTINKGTFSPEGSDAVYLYGNSNLVVNDGTFSGVFAGISAETEYISGAPFTGTIKINGGTISGGSVAMAIEYGEGLGNRVVLKGGTFNGANPSDFQNAIVVLGSADTTLFDSFLASGYHYTNDARYSTTTLYGNMSVASLGGTSTEVEADATTPAEAPTTPANTTTTTTSNTTTTDTISDSKKKAMEEMSKEMEKVLASSTSTKSVKKTKTTEATTKKVVKAPNTGAVR